MSFNTFQIDKDTNYIISSKLDYLSNLSKNNQLIILTLFNDNCDSIRKQYFSSESDIFTNTNAIENKIYKIIITTPVFFQSNQNKFKINTSHIIIYEPHLIEICNYLPIINSLTNFKFIAHSHDLKSESFLKNAKVITANKKYFIKCKDEQIFYILYSIYKFNLLKGKIGFRVNEKIKKKYEIFLKVLGVDFCEDGSNLIVIGDLEIYEECDRVIYLCEYKKDAEEFCFDDRRVEKEKYRLRDLFSAISKGVCNGKKSFDYDRFKSLNLKKTY
ncbi:ATP-dependent DNA/RNA helicase [Gurleya vavrai]